MARLVIHAGTHKTATTQIQQTLSHNRERLSDRGLIYPATGQSAGHHLLVSEWLTHLAPYRDGRPPREHWSELIAQHALGSATVLLSSEEFSRRAPEQVDLQALRAYASAFEVCRLVFVLRNQAAYIQALYLEMQRQYRLPSIGAYVRLCLKKNHASGMYLDYGVLYDNWLSVFSMGEVQLISYEALTRSGRDVTTALLDAVGIRPPNLNLTSCEERSNVSPEPLAAWAANRITAPEVAGPAMVRLAKDILAEEFGPDARSTLFTRAESATIAAHFEPMNRALEARYRAIDPGFTLAPVRVQEGLITRDRLTATFWVRLARRLYKDDWALRPR